MNRFRKAADAYAQSMLGAMYFMLGMMYRDVLHDDAQMLRWVHKAAKRGNADAQFRTGCMYYSGDVLPEDYALAMYWSRLAAERGNGDAQNLIGDMYYNGRGVPKDYAKGMNWFRLAAERGHAYSQFILGRDRYTGEYTDGDVPQDYVVAHMWFILAGARGYKDAYWSRIGTAEKMTPAEISEAQRLAQEWKPKEYGVPPAMRSFA